MAKIIKALYGSIALLKAYCPFCRAYSFIQDGKFLCCDAKYRDIPTKEVIKRESEGEYKRSRIPYKIKKRVLARQENKCIYCGCELEGYIWSEKKAKFIKSKLHFDHFVPWTYSRDNAEDNFVASCSRCNLKKSDKYFKDVISAREYILNVKADKQGQS